LKVEENSSKISALSLKAEENSPETRVPESIVHNATFANGLESWNLKGCRGFVCNGLENPKILPLEGKSFAVATQRTDTWSGIEQTITNRIELETMYDVVAVVRISGPCSKATVMASLYIQEADRSERYVTMGRLESLLPLGKLSYLFYFVSYSQPCVAYKKFGKILCA